VEKQTSLVVRRDGTVLDPSWAVTPITLDDLVLAYMRQARDGAVGSAHTLAVAR
jgi:hypothetical protein